MNKLLAVIALAFFTSCEKQDNGTGKHMSLITNNTGTNYHVAIYIDGEWKGSCIAKSGISGYADCGDLVGAVDEDNVLVSTFVKAGRHSIEMRDAINDEVLVDGTFTSDPDACITQVIELN